MTVEELIALLKEGNPKAKVVRIGYFGEPYEFREADFRFVGFSADRVENDPKLCSSLKIEPPDIGPEPD